MWRKVDKDEERLDDIVALKDAVGMVVGRVARSNCQVPARRMRPEKKQHRKQRCEDDIGACT